MQIKQQIEKKIRQDTPLSRQDILFCIELLHTDEKYWLYDLADKIRRQYMGDEIFIRGIIEFSNNCQKSCLYCGIRNLNTNIERYRISEQEILTVCRAMERSAQTTVVLQSGEDLFYSKEKIGQLIQEIKKQTALAVTLSLGERDLDTYQYWQQCGMDRYLLRFETSSKTVFKDLHPDDDHDYRIECIKNLKKLAVQTGSGFMIGLPGTTDDDLVRDILLCYKLDLDMIGIGPFIPHPDTPLKDSPHELSIDFLSGIVSILRLVCKDAHIPATTAFDAVTPEGRNLVLQRGANIFMPNVTPQKYRNHYLLYPGKPCIDASGDECEQCVKKRILNLGRKPGQGPGHSIHRSVEHKIKNC